MSYLYSMVRGDEEPEGMEKSYEDLMEEYNSVKLQDDSQFDKSYEDLMSEYSEVETPDLSVEKTPEDLMYEYDSEGSRKEGVSAYDYLATLGKASGEMVELGGKAWNIQGRIARQLTEQAYKSVGIDTPAVPGAFEIAGSVAEKAGKVASDYFENQISPAMKRERSKTILAGADDEGIFADDIGFHKIAGMITESIPSTVVGMGSGALITKTLIGTGLKSMPKILTKPLIKLFGEKGAAGVIGGAIGEGTLAGAMNADSTYQEISATPYEELRKSDAYKFVDEKLMAKYPDHKERHEAAKKIISIAGASFVGIITAGSTGILGAPSGAIMGKIIGGESKSLFKNILLEAFTEGVIEENLQSGVERVVENVAIKHLKDPNRGYFEGAAEAAISGAISGVFMGGGMATVATLATKLAGEEEAPTEVPPGEEIIKDVESFESTPKQSSFKKIKQGYIDGNLSKEDLEDIKKKFPDTENGERGKKAIDDIMKEVPEFKAATPEAQKEVSPEQSASLKAFDDAGIRTWGNDFVVGVVKIAPETEETKGIQKIATSLKMGNIVFYDAPKTQLDGVNGFYNHQTNEIFVNKSSTKPLLTVAGHETLHKLKAQSADLYKTLISTLRDKAVGYKEYTDNLNKKRVERGLPELTNKEKLSEEFIADFAGQALTTANFWNKLNAEDPTITKTLAKLLTDIIKQIRAALGTKGRKHFKDIDAVEALAKTYAGFAKEGKAAPETITSKAVRLSKTATKEQIDEAKAELKKVDDRVNSLVEQSKKAALAGDIEKATKLISEAGKIGQEESQPLNEMIQAYEGRDFEKKQREEAEKKKIEQPAATEKVVQSPGDFYTGKAYRVSSGRIGKSDETALDQVNFEADELGNEHVRADATIAVKKHGIDLSKASSRDIVWVTRDLETAKELYTYDETEPEEIGLPKDAVVLTDLGGDGVLIYRGGKLTEKVEKPEKAKPPKKKAPKKEKPAPGSGIRTVRGYIRFLGGINFLNYKGELKDMALDVKYLQNKKTGIPIDNLVDMLIEDNWLDPGTDVSDFLEMLRTDYKTLLSRDRLTVDVSGKKEYQKSEAEKKFEKETAWEPEEPPPGKYVQMKAEDLPLGKELTILEGKSTTGWDVYKVTSKTKTAVKLMDGTEVELEPGTKVEVLKKDLPKKTMALGEDALIKQDKIRPKKQGIGKEEFWEYRDEKGTYTVAPSKKEAAKRANAILQPKEKKDEVPFSVKSGIRTGEPETTGAYSGQIDLRIVARNESGEYLGRIDYAEFEGKAHINMLEVEKEHRRKGVATQLLSALEKEYSKEKVIRGMLTEDGAKFLGMSKEPMFSVKDRTVTEKEYRDPHILVEKRINKKYDDILKIEEKKLTGKVYEDIDDRKLTPKALKKHLLSIKNRDLADERENLKSVIADSIGELIETYKYESYEEGKAIEDYIDSLLKVVGVPRTALPDKRTATGLSTREKGKLLDDSRIKEQLDLFQKKPTQKDIFGQEKQKTKEKKTEPKAVFGQKMAETGKKKKGTPTSVQLDLFEKNKKQIQSTMFSVKDRQPAWYSQMENVLEQKLPNKGTPESMKQAINAFAKKGELEWSGINAFIESRKGEVLKADILGYLKVMREPLGLEAPSFKLAMDSAAIDPEFLSNIRKRPAFQSKGFGGLEIPTQRKVFDSMRAFALNPEIRNAIIELIPVDVVNDFVRMQGSIQERFHDGSMLNDLLTVDSKGHIPIGSDIAGSLVKSVASLAAKDSSASSGKRYFKDLSALLAGDSDSTPGVLSGTSIRADRDGGFAKLVSMPDKWFAADRTIDSMSDSPITSLFSHDIMPSDVEKFISDIDSIAKQGINSKEEKQILLSFLPITPEIKQKALREGMPMFMVAGEKAIGADRGALAKAYKKLEKGADKNKVRKETGWLKGAEGSWKFEIDDSKAKIFRGTKKTIEEFLSAPGGQSKTVLSQILDHPELYKAYPEIAKIPIEITVSAIPKSMRKGAGNSGSFSVAKIAGQKLTADTIKINAENVDIKTTIFHEIQHAIQEIEGFAKGGTPETAPTVDMDKIRDIRKKKHQLYIDPYRIMNKKAGGWVVQEYEEKALKEWEILTAQEDELLSKQLQPYEAYKRLAGEIEARDTSARAELTPAQRGIEFNKAKSLWEQAQKIRQTDKYKAEEKEWLASDMKDADLKKRNESSAHKKVYAIEDKIMDMGYNLNQKLVREALAGDKAAQDLLIQPLYESQGIPEVNWIIKKGSGTSFSVKKEDKKLSPLAQEYLEMLTVAEPALAPTKDTEADPFKGLRKEVAERMESNKGLGRPSFLGKIKKAPEKVWSLFTRSFEDLDAKELGGVANVLRLHKEVSVSSRRRASTLIHKILSGLHGKQYDIFRMEIIMSDMLKDIESGLLYGKGGLPFGFKNKEEVQAYYDEVLNSANADPAIKDALRRRRLVNDKFKTVLVRNGLLHEGVLEDERYFHHQVMEYRAVKEVGDEYTLSPGTGTQALAMRKKGWQIARKGSIKDYNTDYIQSEFEVMAQGITQLETKVTLGRLKGLADMTAALKLQAKAMELEDWKVLIPPDAAVWSPSPGSAWFRASSLTDRMMMQIQSGEITDPNVIKKVWAKGKDATWIIPQELAKTLDNFGKSEIANTAIDKASRATVNAWKKWILINPYRIIKYNLNNMSGDFDIAFAYDPKIMKHFNQARKDLWAEHKGKKLSKELKGELDLAYRQGVIGSGWAMQDIAGVAQELAYDKKLQSLTDSKPGFIKRAWKFSADITAYRENILRLAAYRYFKERIGKGEKNIYAASNKAEVDAVKGKNEKAAKLSRELIGDYGNISAGGQWMRRHLIPFYSWMEVNAPRYVRLMRNLKHEGEGTKKGAKIAGLAVTRIAWKGTKLAVKATALMAAVVLWNRTFFPDEEEELGEAQRRQMHLILGRRSDGTIVTLRFQGALSDALSWFGGEDIAHDIKDVIKGKVSITEKAKDAVLAPVVKLINGIRPDVKVPFELLAGQSYYPDPWFPRPIRDSWEHVARLFSLNSIQSYLRGKPTRGGGGLGAWLLNDIISLGFYTSDPGESAFWNIKKKTFDYLDKQDVQKPRITPTDKSNAMYYYKRALKYGDLKAAEKYLKSYIDHGGTRKGMKISIKTSGPFGNLSKKDRRKFLKTLTEKDKETLAIAEKWYRETYKNPKNVIPWPHEYYINSRKEK